MKWSANLRALRRGFKLVTCIAKVQLATPKRQLKSSALFATGKTRSAKSKVAKTSVAKAKAAKVGPVAPSALNFSLLQAFTAKAGPAKTGPAKTGPAKIGPLKTGPLKTSSAKASPAKTGPVKTSPANTGRLKTTKLDAAPVTVGLAEAGRLLSFSSFGANPGRLKMLAHVPAGVAGQPLVVLLHGCGQDAATFAADSGWIALADRLRFTLLLPEQMAANHHGRCFQWFHPSDTARGSGEAGSIASMTQAAIGRFDSDPRRVFIVGLSAGGAMTAAMLAAYPDVFAAGASVAGLAVGVAQSGMQAILRMASAGLDLDPPAAAARARAAAPAGFAGPWPRLSIWQGQADQTVAPDNATLLATQWRTLHGLTGPATVDAVRHTVRHRSWSNARGPQVELWSLPAMPHAYPVGTRAVQPGRFVAQAPVDATAAIARFFKLS